MLAIMDLVQKLAFGFLGLLVVCSPDKSKAAGNEDVAQGPMAASLSTPPAKLRLLWERYGNLLPDNEIARFIDGRADVKAHGPRDMPVWGEVWQNPVGKASKHEINEHIAKLIVYLQSIQKTEQTALKLEP
jgi:hypothetical protein